MANANIIHLGSGNFNEEVDNSQIPVLIDFWAAWCSPCRAIAPILESLAVKYDSQIKVCKVNVDEESALASKFRIMSIPTLLLFKNGKMIDKMIGLGSVEDLESLIKKAL